MISIVIDKYYHETFACGDDGLLIRIYLIGIIVIICVNLLLLILLVNRSAQGGITDTHSRWLVTPLLVVKYGIIFV